jgi:hypothetical protein
MSLPPIKQPRCRRCGETFKTCGDEVVCYACAAPADLLDTSWNQERDRVARHIVELALLNTPEPEPIPETAPQAQDEWDEG